MTQNRNIPSLLSSAEKEICKRLSKTNKAQRNDNVKVQKIKLGKNGIPRRGNADGLVMLWVFLHILPPQHLHQVGHLLFAHLHPLRVALLPHRPNRHFALPHSLHLKCLPRGDEADGSEERGTVLPVLVMQRKMIAEKGAKRDEKGAVEWNGLCRWVGGAHQEGEHGVRAVDGQEVHHGNALQLPIQPRIKTATKVYVRRMSSSIVTTSSMRTAHSG